MRHIIGDLDVVTHPGKMTSTSPAQMRRAAPFLFGLLAIFSAVAVPRYLAGNPRYALAPDSMYYILSAQRAVEGHWGETFSTHWMPFVSWLAAPLAFIGVTPIASVVTVNFAVAMALLVTLFFSLSEFVAPITGFAVSAVLATDATFLASATIAMADLLYSLLCFLCFFWMVKALIHKELIKDEWILSLACGLSLATKVASFLSVFFLICFVMATGKAKNVARFSIFPLLVVLGLCTVNLSKLGLFTYSPFFRHVGVYAVADQEGLLTHLYDGKNTVVGDYQQFKTKSEPIAPAIPTKAKIQRLLAQATVYVKEMNGLVPTLTLFLACLGGWFFLDGSNPGIFFVAVGWIFVTTIGTLVVQPTARLLLPALPIFYWLAGVGLEQCRRKFPNKAVPALFFVIGTLGNLVLGFSNANWALLKSPIADRFKENGGTKILREEGSGKVVMTSNEYATAVDARARWAPIPCGSKTDIRNYFIEKKADFISFDPNQGLCGDREVLKAVVSERELFEPYYESPSERVFKLKRGTLE